MKLTKMTTLAVSALIVCLLFVSNTSAQGQVMKTEAVKDGQMMTYSADEAVMIPGLTAMISFADNEFKVDFIPPADKRDPAYKEVDIQQGDILMMLNGKRLKSIDQLQELLDELEVGDEIKVGLKRGKKMIMASFPKADPTQTGGQMIMMSHDITTDDDDGQGQMITRTMTFGGPDDGNDVLPLVGLGVLLTDGEDNLKVMQKMQLQGMKVTETDLQPEDIILSINDQAVKSGEQFSSIYEALAGGEIITLKIQRDGKTLDIVFEKPSLGGVQIIRQSGK